MAKRKEIEAASDEPSKAVLPKTELPTVESPSISPSTPEFAVEPIAEALPVIEPVAAAPADVAADTVVPKTAVSPRFIIRPRHRRYALLAASAAIAAALGAVVGAVSSRGFAAPSPRINVASVDDKTMQQSITQLAKEVTTLKANLEAANKAAHSQIAKITEHFDRAASEEMITGSISPPQTVVPVPTPRPAPRIAAVEIQPAASLPVIQSWAIRDAHDGFVYVQGNGDVYQVVPGAPLPGLGPVESVKRQDGRWVVTTPKGIIVSMRDRRYFESF
jgi:hypothetical protein